MKANNRYQVSTYYVPGTYVPPSCPRAKAYQKAASWEVAELSLDRGQSDPRVCTLNHDVADACLPA